MRADALNRNLLTPAAAAAVATATTEATARHLVHDAADRSGVRLSVAVSAAWLGRREHREQRTAIAGGGAMHYARPVRRRGCARPMDV